MGKDKVVISIGRQYGSGGREIGRRLAEIFNIKFYDKELITLAAKQSGFSEDVLKENDEKHNKRRQRAELDSPEDSGASLHPEEVEEVHISESAEKYARCVADQCRRALEIRRHRDRDDHRHGRDLQLSRDGESDRRDHKHSRDIVDERAYQSGEEREQKHSPLDVRDFGDHKL